MASPSIWAVLGTALLLLLALGCDAEQADHSSNALADIAKAKPMLTATPAPKPDEASAPAEPTEPAINPVRRPMSNLELELSSERRARLEGAHPETKGFVHLATIEKKLYGMDLKRGSETPAVTAFDRHARGKWVLFTGPVAEPMKDGLEFHVRYTPRDPADPFGLTSTWFPVRVTGIAGYEPEKYEVGKLAVVLAKYLGNQKATPAFDAVLLEEWFGTEDD